MVYLGIEGEPDGSSERQARGLFERAGARLKENGCDWKNVVRISFFLHESEEPQAVLAHTAALVPVSLDHAEIEFVAGYSRPNKLVEIEITARR